MASLNKKTPKDEDRNTAAKQHIKEAINTKATGNVQQLTMYKDGQHLLLNIDQVETYDKNPRHTVNKQYDSIYLNVKKHGFNKGALDVTQRPGDDPLKFFLIAGGNTVFSILKKLYEETGDKKYYSFNAVYHNWKSESDCLIDHLKENDLRDGFIFIERALGVRQTKIELQAEQARDIDNNELIKILLAEGYDKVNKMYLTRINYAVDTLYPICPHLLDTGIGPRLVQDIKTLDMKGGELYLEINNDLKPSDWRNLFTKALSHQEKLCQTDEHYKYVYNDLLAEVIALMAENSTIKENRLAILLDERIHKKKHQEINPNLLDADLNDEGSQKKPPHTSASINTSTTSEDGSPPSSPKPKNTSPTESSPSLNNNVEQLNNDDDQVTLDPLVYSDDENTEPGTASTPSIGMTNMTPQERIQSMIRGEQYDSGLIAAKSTVDTSGIILHDASAHQKKYQWNDLLKDADSSVFNEMPISISDVREYAPLPDTLEELRQIMFDKAYYFQAYMNAEVDIKPIESGTGFILTSLIDTDSANIKENPKFQTNVNPRTHQFHKHYIAWWVLLGFTDMLQLNHLHRLDLVDKYQIKGSLKEILMQPMASHASIFELDVVHKHKYSLTTNLISLFISDATPKELALFFEMSMVFNKMMKVTNHDIWSTEGRGISE